MSMLPAVVRDSFLENLADTGNVCEAARLVGINRMTAYGWRWSDEDYARRWDVALAVSREQLREKVIETASAMGLAPRVPLLDQQGKPVLDENFEPVFVLDTSRVEPRVLMKLMDKTMRDEVRRVEQHTLHGGKVSHEHYDVVVFDSNGEPLETIDAEWSEVMDG